jgi:hypothetical protein
VKRNPTGKQFAMMVKKLVPRLAATDARLKSSHAFLAEMRCIINTETAEMVRVPEPRSATYVRQVRLGELSSTESANSIPNRILTCFLSRLDEVRIESSVTE